MTMIVTRLGKGSSLSWTEVDANFNNLNLYKLETSSIGTTVQAYSANLDLYAGVTPTAAGLALLDDVSAAAQRTTLELGNVDNTSDATKNAASAILTNKTIVVANNTITTASSVNLTSTELNAALAELALKVIPTGTIIDFAGTTAPTGFLLCPTSQTDVSRATYANLFAVIGTTWGAGDGSTTFGLPWFPADYTSVQADSNVGSATIGNIPNHNHAIVTTDGAGSGSSTGMVFTGTGSPQGALTTYITAAGSGTLNLTAGVRVSKCIKT